MANLAERYCDDQVSGDRPRAGLRFGGDQRFEVVSELGNGASAVVLLVRDARLRKAVAAKLLHSRDGEPLGEALQRAQDEALTLRKLRHKNIIRAYEAGLSQGTPYVLLEYREGTALDRLIEGGPLPVRRALDITLEVARGLEHAHARGVLHLDVKPGNVWITRSGRAKLLDFGIQPELEQVKRETPSNTGYLVGTPAYMSPEQWQLELPDARADVWGVGVMLYELLTGELPFAKCGSHPFSICQAVTSNQTPPRVSARLNSRPSLDTFLSRALARDRSERFQSVSELVRALESVRRTA